MNNIKIKRQNIKRENGLKKNNFENFKSLLGYFSKDKSLYIFAVSLRIIGILIMLYSNLILGQLIDVITKKEFESVMPYLTKLIIILVIGSIFSTTGILFIARITQKIMYNVRKMLNKHVQKLPIRVFEKGKIGGLISIFINDLPQISIAIDQSVTNIFLAILEIILKTLYIMYLSFVIGNISLVFTLIIIYIIFKLGNIIKNEAKIKMEEASNLNSYAEEIIANQTFVKLYNYEEEAKKEFSKKTEKLKNKSIKVMLYSNLLNFISTGMVNLLSAISIFLGAYLSFKGLLTIGSLTIIIRIVGSMMEPISSLTSHTSIMYEAFASDKRLQTVMNEKEELDEGKIYLSKNEKGEYWKDKEEILKEAKGELEFKNVNYGYDKKDKESFNLKDISFEVKENETLAIVGKTGAGKSTITNLIARFYEINSGEILIDGIEIKEIKKEDLRSIISLVLQDINLFSGTVFENIKNGNLNITKEEIIKISKDFGIYEIIEKFEKGLDTYINVENTKMSEGEKQIISILRAAVSTPKILIFDEATSKIDTLTEKSLQKGIKKLQNGKINIVIAHRLSTIKNADIIMVLDEGKIKEIGNHDKLLEEKGIYYNMYKSGLNDFDLK